MNIIFYKKSIFTKAIFTLLIVMLLCSCTNKSQQEIASTDIVKNAESQNGSMYIVNKRSGKVHSHTHGSEIIQNKDNILEIADSLENILKNENYDICRTCFAGLRSNLKNYKDYNFDLIEKFMRLYEFGNLDTETQKFLICIFEVGEWYVDNVYTYQGGLQNVVETESIAKASASDMAYNRWQNYRDTEYYNKKYSLEDTKRILPVVYDSENNPTTLVTYRCDLFKNANYGYGDNKYSKSGRQKLKNAEGELIDEEWKNYCVIDDCSKFAAAVYYHYINKEILKNEYMADKTAYDIDLWGTSSEMFATTNNFTNKIINTGMFSLYTWDNLSNDDSTYISANNIFELKPGDLIIRKNHVEFYIGNNKVVGWGKIHKTYTTKKSFHSSKNGIFSDYHDEINTPYTTFIRVKEVNNQ